MTEPSRKALPRRLARRLVLPLIGAALLAGGLLFWLTRPGTVRLSGESESTTADFWLSARPYNMSADLLPGCQYTFYLTPMGQLWNRGGKAVASVAGEAGLSVQTNVKVAGRYFVHSLTAPDEDCSWTLRLKPL